MTARAYAAVITLEAHLQRVADVEVPGKPTSVITGMATIDISDPGAENMFANQVYDRGGALLCALEIKIGHDGFTRLAREWASRFGRRSASTSDLIALIEEISGVRFDGFFDLWLSSGEKPARW